MADDGWIKWEGGECPAAKGACGQARLRDGHETRETILSGWNWDHVGDHSDIIAYRLMEKPE